MSKNILNKILTTHIRHHMSPATITTTIGHGGSSIHSSCVVYYCLPLSVSSGSKALTSKRFFSTSSDSNKKDGKPDQKNVNETESNRKGEQASNLVNPATSSTGNVSSGTATPTSTPAASALTGSTSAPSSSAATSNSPTSPGEHNDAAVHDASHPHHLDYTTIRNTTVQRLGDTIHFAEQKYEVLERNLMQSINESNRRRFRLYFFGSILFIIIVTVIFGDRMRKSFTEKTAGLAKETLENESLKIQTQELAMAVVQTILNDKEITAHAATFLKEASSAAETQQALLELTMHVLQHPQTFDELLKLSQKLILNLGEDKVSLLFISLLLKLVESNLDDFVVGIF